MNSAKFWTGERLRAANLCELKDCQLNYDNLQGLFFVVRKHEDGSVYHDASTHLFKSANIYEVIEFINLYTNEPPI